MTNTQWCVLALATSAVFCAWVYWTTPDVPTLSDVDRTIKRMEREFRNEARR